MFENKYVSYFNFRKIPLVYNVNFKRGTPLSSGVKSA